jgi:hypothetical protein
MEARMIRQLFYIFTWFCLFWLVEPDPVEAARNSRDVSFPSTQDGIHVFNDQIDVHHLSDAQAAFAATHYAGAQKITRSGAQRLRAINPDFVVLHYRLGLGLGYRIADNNCQPTGDYLAYIDGDDWAQEWPGDDIAQENWFYHMNGQRIYWCAWGWYLADTDDPGWRAWWMGEILRQLAATDSNGLFADSVTVPNYLGSDDWRPALPAYDETFEADWTRRIEDWIIWVQNEFADQYVLIVNAGMLVTSRETTDYSLADGVMVEGFAGWGEYDRFELGDWQLQLNRILDLINQDRVVILQSYVWDTPERFWTLANYLLVKGDHTYINLEVSQDAEWFPEYDLPIGYPVTPLPAAIDELRNENGLYTRMYSNGMVLVNPDAFDGSPITVQLDMPMQLLTGAVGGGDVPDDADISDWRVETTEVTEVTLAPGQAAILLAGGDQPVSQRADPTPVAANSSTLSPELAVVQRSGQTFLTWPEIPNTPTMTYRVYRHTAPIDPTTLSEAYLLAEVPQGSGIYWTEHARALDPEHDNSQYRSLRNYVITDLGPELPDGTGLFVWTTHDTGEFYYAVQSADGSLFVTAGPFSEHISDPAPILAWQSADGLSRVYTQFMDYSTYNPTFDAPHLGNSYMGLPNWAELEQAAGQQQYAYNYWVGLPTAEACGGAVPDQLPLILHIEGWGSRYYVPDSAPYWCAVMIWGDDPNQSWYFGFSATHDYRTGTPALTGPIVNYTEARLLRSVREVIQSVPGIDMERIYVYGQSMGGTGALAFAERYPNIFAGAAAGEPMMNFAAATMWLEEMEYKWGPRNLNLPVEIRGPDAAALAAYQGTGVWDWQNLGAQLAVRRGDEMAFIAIAHGTQDTVIDWESVARPSYAYFYTGQRAFIGEITPDDHTWQGFRYHPNWTFDWMNLRRSESLPAFSYATGSASVPPDGVGGYNMTLEWSSSGNDFAGPPIDLPGEWSVVIRSLSGAQVVNVTPRRLQQFVVSPGAPYTWQNTRLSDGTVIQTGVVIADADGLITIEGFEVDEGGSRLSIRAG